jgi:hypothetical protein
MKNVKQQGQDSSARLKTHTSQNRFEYIQVSAKKIKKNQLRSGARVQLPSI